MTQDTDTVSNSPQPDITPPLFKYGLITAGLILALFAGFVTEWKNKSAVDAQGDVAEVQAEIENLKEEAQKAKSADDKKEFEEQWTELQKGDLVDAQKELRGETVDRGDGVWMYGMLAFIGKACIALGLLALIASGSNHEKLGALIALGFLASQI